jgi:hypothetical protein
MRQPGHTCLTPPRHAAAPRTANPALLERDDVDDPERLIAASDDPSSNKQDNADTSTIAGVKRDPMCSERRFDSDPSGAAIIPSG